MAKSVKVSGRMSVKTLKANFLETFNVSIRVYNGKKFADDDSTLAKIRSNDTKGGDVEIHGNLLVGNLEQMFKDTLGISIQVEDKKGGLADNSLTLAQVSKG